MYYALSLALLVMALFQAVPAAARAETGDEPPAGEERVNVQVKTAPGEVHHFTTSATSTWAVDTAKARTYTINSVFTMVTDFVYDDNSADVRGFFDVISVDGQDNLDLSSLRDVVFTYRLHPDGSVTDFETDLVGGASGLTRVDTFPTFGVPFPEGGLLVGESFDAEAALPFVLPDPDAPKPPVHTTLEALTEENDRPAARLVQTISVPTYEAPIGPFGSVGMFALSLNGNATQVLDLETGWPLRTEGSLSYKVVLTGQGGERNTVQGHSESTLTQTPDQ